MYLLDQEFSSVVVDYIIHSLFDQYTMHKNSRLLLLCT